MNTRILNTNEVAEILNISRSNAFNMMHHGIIFVPYRELYPGRRIRPAPKPVNDWRGLTQYIYNLHDMDVEE